jgi:hypothetical protein
MKFLKIFTHNGVTTLGCEYDQNHMIEIEFKYGVTTVKLNRKEEEGGIGREIWIKPYLSYTPSFKIIAEDVGHAIVKEDLTKI